MINWKLRLQNGYTLVALITTGVGLVYQVLSWFEIVPKVSSDELINALSTVITMLAMLGIVTDPTTSGISDSTNAMTYEQPNNNKD